LISDDHAHERALTAFCHMIAIHGLTTIAHHCSILITLGSQGNVSAVLETHRGGTGLPLGKSRKSRNPGGRSGRMERIGTIFRTPLGASVPAEASARARSSLIMFNHHDHGRAGERGWP
jgi:hypothetical protein